MDKLKLNNLYNIQHQGKFVAALVFCIFLHNAQACDLNTNTKDATVDEIAAYFKNENKQVITFIGYSGSEYEDNDAMLDIAGQILDQLDPAETIINIGATPEGIGAVYELAKRKNLKTTGIVSTQAKEFEAKLSPCVDDVFYVRDTTWGGYMKGSEQLSPTSSAMVNNSDIIIGIGGGNVGRDELIAAKKLGKEVRFFPADMNYQIALEKAQKKGLPSPTDFNGAAGEYLNMMSEQDSQ